MDWKTTSTILDRLHSSNGAAWDDLLQRFRNPIIRFATQMGLSRTDAEDVSQETFMAFFTAYLDGKYDRSKGRLSKWLFGIATRQLLNTRRRLAIQHARVKLPSGSSFWAHVPDTGSNTALLAKEWERAVLEEYLKQVRTEVAPETYRAFEMVVWTGLTPTETASALGIPIKAVYNAKHRVVKRIRQLRDDYENALLGEIEHALP